MHIDDRLPTHLLVSAVVRNASLEGKFIAITRKGNAQSGMISLIVNLMNKTAKVYTQMRQIDGQLGWFAAMKGEAVPEHQASEFLRKSAMIDPDLWIVEVESKDGSIPFDGPVIT